MKPDKVSNADLAYQVVTKLFGEIIPIADSAIDGERLENLYDYAVLAERLINDLYCVASFKNSPYDSARKIGEAAERHIEYLRSVLGEEE